MCDSKKSCSVLSAIIGVAIAATAIAVAVFAIIKFMERRRLSNYLACDCYDDFEDDFGDEDFSDCCCAEEIPGSDEAEAVEEAVEEASGSDDASESEASEENN